MLSPSHGPNISETIRVKWFMIVGIHVSKVGIWLRTLEKGLLMHNSMINCNEKFCTGTHNLFKVL